MLKTLLFPTTIPHQGTIRQLLLFFDEVFQYAPAEDSVSWQMENFHHYAPVPFGQRLERFQQLCSSIKKNRAEYYGGGLSRLSKNAAHDLDESAVWHLIASLSAKDQQNQHHDTLDQARLFLKLAEMLAQEESEINQALATISQKSKALLDELKGELETLAEIELPLPAAAHTASSLEMRTRAWGHLFQADQQAADFWILTTDQETFELISDHASPLIDHRPELLFSLTMPEVPQLSQAEFYAKRTAARKGGQASATSLAKKLREAATKGRCPEDFLTPELTAWSQSIQTCFAELPSQTQIDCYLLPQSLSQLFTKITRKAPPNRLEASGLQAIITVLKSNASFVTSKSLTSP